MIALSPESAIILEITRTARLFEIYDTSTDAARSFTSFLPNFVRNQIKNRPAAEEERIAA